MKKLLCVLCLLLALVCVLAACDTETPQDEHTHTFGEWSVSKAATCVAKGEEKRTCSCGESETREIAILSHTFGDWSVSKAPTCIAKGEEKRSCACGESETREVAATGKHTYGIDNKCTGCQLQLVYTEGLEYTLNTDGESYSVTGIGTATATELAIPAYYNGKPVTAIGNEAFIYCTSLTSIEIPEGVTHIGRAAFAALDTITELTLPASVTTIGKEAFEYTEIANLYITDLAAWCQLEIGYDGEPWSQNLYLNNVLVTHLEIPNTVTHIRKHTFYHCDSLVSITIPESVISIDNMAIYHCTSLTSVAFAKGSQLTSIGDCGFSGCSSLTSIEIPTGVTNIGWRAFSNCTSLASIDIPASVGFIGGEAFYCCNSLNYTVYNNGKYLGNASNPYIYLAGIVDNSITSFAVLNTTKCIGSDAFRSCTKLASITIPNSVMSIGEWAFYDCSSLKGVYITDITAWYNIKFNNYAANPLCCAKKLYLNGTLVTDLVIPSMVTSIGNCTFYNCTSLTSIKFPASVTSIGYDAFSGCTSLTSIEIPASVTYIAGFSNCTSLISVTFEEGSQLTSIGSDAFSDCTSLTSIKIPASVTSIDYRAFRGCTSLTSVEIPASVTSIGNNAFHCTSLMSLTFAETSGWWIARHAAATIGATISTTALADPAKAATYLISTYCDYYWKRG